MKFWTTLLRMLLGAFGLGAIATMATDPSQWGQKWVNAAGTAQQSYVDGIQNTQVDPTALAIQNEQAMLAGVTQAVTSGFWRNQLARAGKAKWQGNSVAKANNYGTGIQSGRAAYDQAMTTWGPIILQTASAARQMPGGSIDNKIARSAYVQRTLYNRKRGL